MRTENNFRQLWGKPILIAIMTICGLLLALIGDGIWDVFSWILLAVPVFSILYYLARKKR